MEKWIISSFVEFFILVDIYFSKDASFEKEKLWIMLIGEASWPTMLSLKEKH